MGARLDPRGARRVGTGRLTPMPVLARPEPATAATPLEPWEVFRQEKDGDPMRHGGSVMAPDADLALHYARELYGRRQESLRLWVVRRADIVELADPDLLDPPLDRSFKKPGGYVMRDKLAAARAQSGQAKPKARASAHDTTGRRRPADRAADETAVDATAESPAADPPAAEDPA